MNARVLYPVPASPVGSIGGACSPIGSPLGFDPANWGPATSSTIRVLDGVPPIQRGTAKVLCPGDEVVLVKAENTSVEIAETIDVVLTTEMKGDACFDPASFAWPHVVAHLCWGIGSQTFNAWVDVLQGTHFSVVAELLKVSVKYQLFVPPWAPMPCDLPEFKVSGGLGYGCSKRIQLTQIAAIEKPGDKAVLCMPPFAEAFHVMPADGSAMTDLSMRILPFGGALGVPVPNPKFGELLPIMGGAEFVEVTNTGQGPLLAFLVFILGL